MNSEGADPGWRPAFSQATRTLVRFGVKARAERVPDALTATRVIFLGIVYALFMFLLVLAFIEPTKGAGVGRAPYLIGLVGVASLSSIWWVLGRPLSTTDPKSLAGSWRTRFFIGLGLAEVVALIAFAAALVVGNRWLYVIGLGFALYGLWMIAPSRKNLARDQDRLRLQGSSLDLTSALLGLGRGS